MNFKKGDKVNVIAGKDKGKNGKILHVLRNKDKGNFLERYLKSFCHAVDGIVYAIKYEHNMIIILSAMIVTTFAGLHYSITTNEWLFIIFCFSSV